MHLKMGSQTHTCTLTKRDNVLFYDGGSKDKGTINGSKQALDEKKIVKNWGLQTIEILESIE